MSDFADKLAEELREVQLHEQAALIRERCVERAKLEKEAEARSHGSLTSSIVSDVLKDILNE